MGRLQAANDEFILIVRNFTEHSKNSPVIRSTISRNASETTIRKNIGALTLGALNYEEALYSCRRISNILSLGLLFALRRHRIELHRKISEESKAVNGSALLQPKESGLYHRILAAFKMVRNSNKIYEGAAMLFLPHYVKDSVANALNNCMCAENRLAFLAASVRN